MYSFKAFSSPLFFRLSKADSSEIKIEKAEKDGKSIPELIKSITAEMRKTQTPKPVVEKVPAEKTEIAKQKEAKVA